MSESLSEKLKSLGVQVGAQQISPRREKKGFPIAEVMPGRFISTAFGNTFAVESAFPADYQHGIVSFTEPFDLHMLC
ncbi:MAG TPA: hypothetical protein VFF68_09030, partial [Anaerolineaceae bacterium]|nr:hypothetical protein [Anaerolineaceae bacterium]